MQKKENKIRNIVITFDLNCDWNIAAGHKLSVSNLDYHINSPTRVTQTASKVIDQFITNCSNFIKEIEIHNLVSNNDYHTIGLKLDFSIPKKLSY